MPDPEPIRLRSRHLALTVEPGRGFSATSLRDADGDEWLFFDPARGPAVVAAGTAYDDVWRGGFEELFPSDAPGYFDGRDLPDHGELWSGPFAVLERDELVARGRRACTSVPATVEKSFQLDAEFPRVRVRYAIRNEGAAPLRFLFKLHLAARVEPSDRLLLPGGRVTAVAPGFGHLGEGTALWPVPKLPDGRALDLSTVRPVEEGFREFVYVRGLPEGSCGLLRSRTGASLRLTFDQGVFPSVWLFITYGGWRDYNTVVLEPCTNWPKDLPAAAANGECAVLRPGESLGTSVQLEIAGREAATR